jgi:hypothetical protein
VRFPLIIFNNCSALVWSSQFPYPLPSRQPRFLRCGVHSFERIGRNPCSSVSPHVGPVESRRSTETHDYDLVETILQIANSSPSPHQLKRQLMWAGGLGCGLQCCSDSPKMHESKPGSGFFNKTIRPTHVASAPARQRSLHMRQCSLKGKRG